MIFVVAALVAAVVAAGVSSSPNRPRRGAQTQLKHGKSDVEAMLAEHPLGDWLKWKKVNCRPRVLLTP